MLVGPIADESSDTILGVIQCFNKKNGPFNSTDEVILEQIAKQAANILTTTLRSDAPPSPFANSVLTI